MCGIFGVCVEGEFTEEHASLVEALFLESQLRGRHASGITWASGMVPEMTTVKHPVPAVQFVTSRMYLSTVPIGQINVRALGHCRYSTSGDWENNDNNQPLTASNFSLVHNGLVSMGTKEEFEEQYSVETKSYNDSEVILRHVLRVKEDDQGDKIPLDKALSKALHRIHRVEPPIFALGIMGRWWKMLAVRDHLRPLWLFSCDSLGVKGFASTEGIIARVGERLGVQLDRQELPPYTIVNVEDPSRYSTPLSFEYPKEFRFKRPQLVFPDILQPDIVKEDPRLDFPVAVNKDFRKLEHRLRAFLLYYAATIVTWDIDPAYPAINYLFRRYELSKEQEYWVCWLYGCFYQVGTLFWFMQEFPEFEKVDIGRLERWHKEHWRQLRYETDRRYCKGHLVEMFQSYQEAVLKESTSQEEFFAKLLTSDDPVVNFHNVWKAVTKFDRFGRYSAYYYTEALHRCMGMPILADTMFLSDAQSSRNGLCYAMSKDHYVDAKMTKDILKELNTDLDELLLLTKETFPHITVDMWLLESALCAYKGLYRRRRYIGYYIDRLAEEICHIQEDQAEPTVGVDWQVLWQMRQACFPPEYLGELWPDAPKPWLIPREEAQNAMMDHGTLVGLGPVAKRGLL